MPPVICCPNNAKSSGPGPVVTTVTYPTSGLNITEGTSVTVAATCTQVGGVIQQVEFFIDASSKGVDSSSPYAAPTAWTASGLGAHTASATGTSATDGQTGNSPTINFNVVETTMALAITSPTTQSPVLTRYFVGDTLTVTATASQPLHTITQVEFFIRNNLGQWVSFGTDPSSPYSKSRVLVVSDADRSTGDVTRLRITGTNEIPTTQTSSEQRISVVDSPELLIGSYNFQHYFTKGLDVTSSNVVGVDSSGNGEVTKGCAGVKLAAGTFLIYDNFNNIKSFRKTTDGGRSWTTFPHRNGATSDDCTLIRTIPENTSNLLLTVGNYGTYPYKVERSTSYSDFLNPSVAVDFYATPFSTLTLTDVFVRDIFMVDSSTGYLVVTASYAFNTGFLLSAVYKTTNGGVSWSKVANIGLDDTYPIDGTGRSIAIRANSIWFTSPSVGYIVGESYDYNVQPAYPTLSALWKTTDGGVTWNTVRPTNTDTDFGYKYLFPMNNTNAIILDSYGSSGRLTTDGGNTWGVLNGGAGLAWGEFNYPFVLGNCFQKVSASEAWLSGYSNLYKTTDSGVSWVAQTRYIASQLALPMN